MRCLNMSKERPPDLESDSLNENYKKIPEILFRELICSGWDKKEPEES